MFSILCIDVLRESAKSDSFLLTYYLLNYSGNYIVARDEEKFYAELRISSKAELLTALADVINKIDNDDEDVIITTSLVKSTLERYLSESSEYFYIDRQISVKPLQELLGYSSGASLYDMFISEFGSCYARTTVEMFSSLVDFRLVSRLSSEYSLGKSILIVSCRCLSSSTYKISFAWGTLTRSFKFNLLGTQSGGICLQSSTRVFELNKFIDELFLRLSESGISADSLVWLSYNRGVWGDFERVLRLCCCTRLRIKQGIVFLNELLSSLSLFRYAPSLRTYTELMHAFLGAVDLHYTAGELSRLLEYYSKPLGLCLSESEGLVIGNKEYRHDFSVLLPSYEHSYRDSHFILLDCEGTTQHGATEIGGLIVAVRGSALYKLGSFYFQRADFESAFEDLLSTWQAETKRKVLQGVPIYTYGNNDKAMFMQALGSELGRKTKRKYFNYLNFIDCQPAIFKLLEELGVDGSKKLNEVAKNLGVVAVSPRHNALNDAKTLFNVFSVGFLVKGVDFLDGCK